MRATPEDHLLPAKGHKRPPVAGLVLAGAVLLALLAYWFWPGEGAEAPVPEETAGAPVAAERPRTLPEAPDIPRRAEPPPATEAAGEKETPAPPEPPPLPTAEESDAMLLAALGEVGLDRPAQTIAGDHPLQNSAALVDASGRGRLLRKLLGVGIDGDFAVDRRGEQVFMAEAGFRRYDGVAQSLAAVDTEAAVARFHALRPLFERAYEGLGLDPGDFDNAVIRTLDQVLATPVIEEPIRLERESVVYTYADPELEGLTGLQKQLLRMGPDNLRRIQAQARSLREALLSG